MHSTAQQHFGRRIFVREMCKMLLSIGMPASGTQTQCCAYIRVWGKRE